MRDLVHPSRATRASEVPQGKYGVGYHVGTRGQRLVRELDPVRGDNGAIVRMGVFQCSCGKEFTCSIGRIAHDKQSCCDACDWEFQRLTGFRT